MKIARLLRNPLSLLFLRNLVAQAAHKIGAKKLRSESQIQTRPKPSDITDVNLGQWLEVDCASIRSAR